MFSIRARKATILMLVGLFIIFASSAKSPDWGWILLSAMLAAGIALLFLPGRGIKKAILDFDNNSFVVIWYNFFMVEKRHEAPLDTVRAVLIDSRGKYRITYTLLISDSNGFSLKVRDRDLREEEFNDLRLKLDEIYSRMEKFNRSQESFE